MVVEGLEHPRHGALGERVGVQIGSLLGDGQRVDGVRRRHGPGDSQPRRERLREGAEMDHGRLVVERRERGYLGSEVPQLGVGLVLEDGDVLLPGDAHELEPALEREGGALRVLEGRVHVDELGARLIDDPLELRGPHSLVVAADGGDASLVSREDLQRCEVGGVFDDDRIARVEEDLGGEVDSLLGPARHDHVFRTAGNPAAAQPLGDPRPQGSEALGRPVLQRRLRLLGEDALVGAGDGLDRKRLWRGKPAGEGEDVRPFRDLEDLPDGRCLHARHARRQSKLHAATSFLRLRRDSVSGCCCNGTRVSSFTAERTTVVCVRVTPAMRRRESLMSRSSDSVSRVTTLSR